MNGPVSTPSDRRGLDVLLLLVVPIVLVRLIGVGHYPMIHPDEGFWSIGARNYILFGDPFLDGRLHPFLSPATFVALSGLFTIAPPSLPTARLFSIGCGLLSCSVMWWIGRRCFPRRPWLLLLLFGMSTLSILIHRIILLEAHQMLWLVLAAAFWLTSSRRSVILAGIAYGIALLVKSNSLYLLPAFALSALGTLPREKTNPPSGLQFPNFLVIAVLTAGGGYLAAWCVSPERFTTAFRYEVDGQHFAKEGVLFHVGRFGLNPTQAVRALGGLAFSDPVALLLGLAGLVLVLCRRRSATRADWLFVGWLGFGLVVHLGQIYVEHRYLATLAPALAYLSARFLEELLDRVALRKFIKGETVVGLLLAVFLLYHGGRFVFGLARADDRGYWSTVRWLKEEVPPQAKVLAAPYVGISLPQRSYDFYRSRHDYGREDVVRPLAEVVDELGIDYVIIEAEWSHYQNDADLKFLARRGQRLVDFGEFVVYRILPTRGPQSF
jgi:hypothetical protein